MTLAFYVLVTLGIIVLPEDACTGCPTTVFTSTMSFIDDMAVCISSLMGCSMRMPPSTRSAPSPPQR